MSPLYIYIYIQVARVPRLIQPELENASLKDERVRGERGRGKSRRIGGEMQTGISVGSRMRGRGTVREGERRGEAMSE